MNKFRQDIKEGSTIYLNGTEPAVVFGGFGSKHSTIGTALFVTKKNGESVRLDSMNSNYTLQKGE